MPFPHEMWQKKQGTNWVMMFFHHKIFNAVLHGSLPQGRDAPLKSSCRSLAGTDLNWSSWMGLAEGGSNLLPGFVLGMRWDEMFQATENSLFEREQCIKQDCTWWKHPWKRIALNLTCLPELSLMACSFCFYWNISQYQYPKTNLALEDWNFHNHYQRKRR